MSRNSAAWGGDVDQGLAALNAMKLDALISEAELARILQRDPKSIKRAVDRQELPPPCRFIGRNVWTVGAIIRHVEAAIDRANHDVSVASYKITELASYRG